MSEQMTVPAVGVHGASRLPAVDVDSYNVEVRDEEGFVGDRASRTAFQEILERLRKPLRKAGADPFGKEESEEIGKKKLEAALTGGDPEAAGVVQGAIEEFAQTLTQVIKRFFKLKDWRDTERIVIGGGFRQGRVGEIAIGRASVLLKQAGHKFDLRPVRHHPDEAALIGAVHLAPAWMFEAHNSILAADIGGTNIRAGVVALNLKKADDFSEAAVWKSELWRHADDEPTREQAVKRLVSMLKKLITRANKEGLKLAPFIGVSCPGRIEEDGSIAKGAQNLPGNWASSKFHLPSELTAAIPTIGEHETAILMHNDAVVHGLSEVPFMDDVRHWGVLTIGTGLGNARFTNRAGATTGRSPAE
jgi:predicted NBD/HSP70 family sugar kinase